MKKIEITEAILTGGASIIDRGGREEDLCLRIARDGAGLDVTWLNDVEERYLTFWLEAKTEHSVPVNMLVYSTKEPGPAVFDIRFGVLPGMRTGVCIDLQWLDARVLFPETCPGALKVVCHGRRVEKDEIEKILLTTLPLDGEIEMNWSPLYLTEEYPDDLVPADGSTLPDGKLVDELGQNKRKEWGSKLHSTEEMVSMLHAREEEVTDGYPFDDWSAYGGWRKKKLTQGTGFFTKHPCNLMISPCIKEGV